MRRCHIETQTHQMLAENCQVLAFAGSPQDPDCHSSAYAEGLFDVTSDANMAPGLRRDALQRVLEGIPGTAPLLEHAAHDRAKGFLVAHAGVRSATRPRGVSQRVAPHLLVYVFLPVIKS
jgi:hypothetical protein